MGEPLFVYFYVPKTVLACSRHPQNSVEGMSDANFLLTQLSLSPPGPSRLRQYPPDLRSHSLAQSRLLPLTLMRSEACSSVWGAGLRIGDFMPFGPQGAETVDSHPSVLSSPPMPLVLDSVSVLPG